MVGTSGENLSRFLPKKEFRDSTTELIPLLCFNFYIELTLFKVAGRSISGWIPSLKTGAAVRQPFCSQLEERLMLETEKNRRRFAPD